jgi:hypothetical protein
LYTQSLYLSTYPPIPNTQANFIRKYNARGRNFEISLQFEKSLLCQWPLFSEQFVMPEAGILRTVCYARGRHFENSLLCQRPVFSEQFAMPEEGILEKVSYAKGRGLGD